MNKIKKTAVAVAVAATLTTLGTGVAYAAYPVIDVAAIKVLTLINGSINAMNTNLAQLLYNIGTAINTNGSKIVNTIEATSRNQLDYNTAAEKARRAEDAQKNYQVLQNVCSDAGSGGAVEVAQGAGATKGVLRPGGGGKIANSAIAQAVNSPAPVPEIDASRAAKVNSQFCDADDFAAYGGSKACPAIAKSMPGAVKRLDSILMGAGPNGKSPDPTFTQSQTDVARMYVQNTVRRSVAPQLQKGDVDTPAGAQYIGLWTMLQALLSAAADPMEQRIANSQPNKATRDLLQESLASPSAAAYYQQTASEEAKRTGTMSAREFEGFEVGRRYANTEYQADLQAMSGDNLAREQIRVMALNSWLLRSLKDEVERGNVLAGQHLAIAARQEYGPLLLQKFRAIAGGSAGTP